MTDLSIAELLRGLDPALQPAPGFAGRLRADLEAELEHGASWVGSDESNLAVGRLSNTTTEKGLVMETLAEKPVSEARWQPRWLVAGAAAIALAVLAVTGLRFLADSDSTQVATDPTSDFAETDVTAAPDDSGSLGFENAVIARHVVDESNKPYRVAVGTDVWVLSLDGTLTRRDPVTLDVLYTRLVPESSLMAATADAVWIADAVSGDVLQLDASSGDVVATIATGIRVQDNVWRSGGLGMLSGETRTFSRIGMIAAADGSVWVADQDGRVLQIDPVTAQIVREVPVDIDVDAISIDGNHMLVADRDAGVIVVIDLTADEEIYRQAPTDSPLVSGLVRDGIVYTQNPDTSVINRVDLATGGQTTSEPFGPIKFIPGIPHFPPAPQLSELGLLVMAKDGLHRLDPVTLESLGLLHIEDGVGEEMTIGPDGSVWVAEFIGRRLTRLTPNP